MYDHGRAVSTVRTPGGHRFPQGGGLTLVLMRAQVLRALGCAEPSCCARRSSGGALVRWVIQVNPQGRRPMEHKRLSDLSNVADLVPETPKASLTRRERLERWIQVLDREPGRALKTLHEIEHKPRDARRGSRVDNSPLSVAFNDPILRADGLASDRLGDARKRVLVRPDPSRPESPRHVGV